MPAGTQAPQSDAVQQTNHCSQRTTAPAKDRAKAGTVARHPSNLPPGGDNPGALTRHDARSHVPVRHLT
ncbi:hypothetical protein GCM10025734_48280 [Kitasatospora paranensis]